MNFLEELRWRGMIHNEDALMPGTAEYLNAHKTTGYIGFDPTGDSLHIGNLATIMLLVHLQRDGHHPIALAGGATGRIGDPSGKDSERKLLSVEQINHNLACIQNQLAQFLDFDSSENPAIMVNNYDWFSQIGFLDFLRDIGKHISVNYMTAKESVKKRLAGDSGISYTEFAYQLVQGYDFLHLFENNDVHLQMGGADQWGNITTGTHLIHKKHGHDAKAFALTCPLITREDGSKFGKSADGTSVWLDPKKTSPYEFYQYWLNVSDDDAAEYIKKFTLLDKESIDTIIASHKETPHLRPLQHALAEDVTRRVHGDEGLDSAKVLTKFLFARKYEREDLVGLSLDKWQEVAQSSPDTISLDRLKIAGGINVLDLLLELGITSSKGEGRRAIQSDKSISINAEKCENIETEISEADAFHGNYMLIQKGKKKKYIVEIV